jgi:hypothetical protein
MTRLQVPIDEMEMEHYSYPSSTAITRKERREGGGAGGREGKRYEIKRDKFNFCAMRKA